VVQKSTAAALNQAAVMAQASRIFEEFESEFPGLADSCLISAVNAWRWANRNPNVQYSQDVLNDQYEPNIFTGAYGDEYFDDEFQWAAAELFITTQEDSFLAKYNPLNGSFDVPSWNSVGSLALYSLGFHRQNIGPAVDTTDLKSQILALANKFREESDVSAYRVSIGQSNGNFVWGSNGVAANQGIAMIQAFSLTKDSTYLYAAQNNLDYLLGRNAVGYCFVTGKGSNSTMHPHHRPSQADGIADPVPGLLAGGPNPAKQDDCSNYLGNDPANAYSDTWCSYASNENAINWNAALSYLAGAIEAIYSTTGLP
ncbi:MAG: glycoside hydrolase family 9 protein, partial [Anaerolineales bacterium]|nr:glycoside hydrolase family 9 protein [Anaerolineales bacterium]